MLYVYAANMLLTWNMIFIVESFANKIISHVAKRAKGDDNTVHKTYVCIKLILMLKIWDSFCYH